MNIKSLLLGSAAALIAVTGVRAADVIVPVAPDPVDYVRVCDVYGKGFYYIPGTETCLSIGGYVRFKYLVDSNQGSTNFADGQFRNDNGDDYNARTEVRVRLDFDAREETELGTLRGFARGSGHQQCRSGSRRRLCDGHGLHPARWPDDGLPRHAVDGRRRPLHRHRPSGRRFPGQPRLLHLRYGRFHGRPFARRRCDRRFRAGCRRPRRLRCRLPVGLSRRLLRRERPQRPDI